MMNFEELNLIAPLLKAVKDEGYEEPTPIQQKAIPHILAGRDIFGCAQTGTGKTAAFALPILQRLCENRGRDNRRPVRVLALTPTRELASQIGDSFNSYGQGTGIRTTVIFGGVNQRPQAAALERGVDILVATPGRLLDLTYQGLIDYYALEVFVLDEADRMLDMGFINDVRKIVSMLPEKRQTLLFSATMPDEILKLSQNILHEPVKVEVQPPCSTVELIDQSVYFVEKMDKPNLLTHLFRDPALSRVLIFTRTKYGADKVARHLSRNRINAMAIHGNKSQGAREQALDYFKNGQIRALVATDIASRGIDVDNVTHVINFELPNEQESYVHRIGRTARAGAEGIAISFCDTTEQAFLRDIERLIKKNIRRETDNNPFKSCGPTPPTTDLEQRGRGQSGNWNRGGGNPSHRPSGRSTGSSGYQGRGNRSSSASKNRP